MNTIQTSDAEGNTLVDDVLSLVQVGTDGRTAVQLPSYSATIGLKPGAVGIFSKVDAGDIEPGRIVRVTFDDAGDTRTIIGIAQPLHAPLDRQAVEVVVSLPTPVRRRVWLACVTRLEELDEVVDSDHGRGATCR